MLVVLGLLPAATYVLTGYAVRPAGQVFAPLRLALVRAAVLVSAVGAILVEVLGAAHALTHVALVLTWSVATLLALLGAAVRYRRDRRRAGDAAPVRRLPDFRGWARAMWTGAGRPERIMMIALAALLLAELLLAIISPPNNYDSQTYHLPRIEHWVQQRDVEFFPTRIHRQLTMAPGAEYLLLHLRLLTGGSAFYNLLQYSAGIGCALVASRIAGQFGGSARAQVLAAFVFGTAPMVALESTSTQTDLVVAAWTACVATLVLDGLHRRARAVDVTLLGLATGLTALTKENGLLAAGPLLVIWGVAQLRQDALRARRAAGDAEPTRPAASRWLRAPLRTAGGTVAILVLAAAVAGPFLLRVDDEYDNFLGPDYLRDSISMQRHDPPSILVNALRIGHTALETPITPLNEAEARGIKGLSRDIDVDPNDPRTTFTRTSFPSMSWIPDEDRASFPVQAVLVLLGAGFVLVRPSRRVPAGQAWPVRVYASAWWLSVILYVSTIKWQPWGNRLIMYLLALGAPLAGLWLDALFRRRTAPGKPAPQTSGNPAPEASGKPEAGGEAALRASGEAAPHVGDEPGRHTLGRRIAAGVAVAALVIGGCAGGLAVGYGWPRRLVGTGSVFTDGDMKALFQRRPKWRPNYEWAAAAVRASGAKRVGLVQDQDTWEYPWWLLLPGRDIEAEQSMAPDIPPVKPDQVDAMVCVEAPVVCAQYVPHGWKLHMRNGIGYALPPGK
ncbi:phospholipid carrier-dependent glycosyltransferase [Rugosimonospora africana]|uniref:Dolichyl-phosphate-mannose-protein mannosyltransferase n=1 Tax=Rugosimonospora africana TaxID=556532 RepID=A0A8J3QPJ7_9ACTN|nr:phospholipid carrier-dependent glycosyltransferase [Rugosimonospora africana]GIH13088.1 hypothetical protein Raf01_12600 [Rugosimonospora africana]